VTRAAAFLRALGPAMTRVRPTEALRTAVGVAIGLICCVVLAHLVFPGQPDTPAALLFAPLGATAFLVIGVPNSPLAQPWSAIVGNTSAALVALLVIQMIPNPALALAGAVGLATLAMFALRAAHPPAVAVALLIALNAGPMREAGLTFAFRPVFLETLMLVGFAVLWNRATGRVYPFRQPADNTHRPVADPRTGLDADQMAAILSRMNMAANIGPEDLARLIAAARAEVASLHAAGLTCGQIMSRNPVTVQGDMTLAEVGARFRANPVKVLPVTDGNGTYLGTLNQSRFIAALDDSPDATAADIMRQDAATLPPDSPLAPLIRILAAGDQANVPVVAAGQVLGVITRTDLIRVMAAGLVG
jgi:CBS domain-containing membrane protein